jgi:hypothetical protein
MDNLHYQGLEYMHWTECGAQASYSIAPCAFFGSGTSDGKWNNVMMDSTPLYEGPIRPVANYRTRDFSRLIRPRSRTLHPVKCYIIDFGHAYQYRDERDKAWFPIMRVGPIGYGGDTSAPEFRTQESVDPFPVDVYRAGNIKRQYYTEPLLMKRSDYVLNPG